MEYLLSISFKDFSFKSEMIEFILNTYVIKSIEYNKSFQWHKTNKEDIKNLDCDQIQFNINEERQLIIQNLNNSLPRIYCAKITLQMIKSLEIFFENILPSSMITGSIQTSLDAVLQNTEDIDRWKRRNLNIPTYIQILPTPNYIQGAPGMDMIPKEFISIESLPGHYHLMNYDEKLWFGSCWQMYFSETYYKYIPKPLFDSFNDCFKHEIIDNGLRKITLFENPEEYDLPENRARQWAFRRQLGIDSIAHELTRSNNRIEPENLPVLITKKNCQVGETQVIRFLDSNDQLVSSDKAIKKEIKEYLNDGITVVFEKNEML